MGPGILNPKVDVFAKITFGEEIYFNSLLSNCWSKNTVIIVSYSNNVYSTCNSSKKNAAPLETEFNKILSVWTCINQLFFLLSFQCLYMPTLILLPLDGHNFKIMRKLLQNKNLLFMKTINKDLVPRKLSLLIRWNMRIIHRN